MRGAGLAAEGDFEVTLSWARGFVAMGIWPRPGREDLYFSCLRHFGFGQVNDGDLGLLLAGSVSALHGGAQVLDHFRGPHGGTR